MSLAEELLADLEDGSDEEEQEELKDLIRQNLRIIKEYNKFLKARLQNQFLQQSRNWS